MTERQSIIIKKLRGENLIFKRLLIKLRRDLRYLYKLNYNSSTPRFVISSRISMINDALVVGSGK